MKQAKYIVIEGHDGTGKSTQVGIIRQKLAEIGIESIEFHEPAGSPIADAIRTVIKNGNLERIAMTDLLLFTAARCDTWETMAQPALESGKWVIAARNYYSSIAFQGYASGLSLDLIDDITKKSTDERYFKPDAAFILNLEDNKERVNRIGKRGELEIPDTFESRDDTFQSKVQNGYTELAKSRNIPIISANQSIEKISDDLWEIISTLL